MTTTARSRLFILIRITLIALGLAGADAAMGRVLYYEETEDDLEEIIEELDEEEGEDGEEELEIIEEEYVEDGPGSDASFTVTVRGAGKAAGQLDAWLKTRKAEILSVHRQGTASARSRSVRYRFNLQRGDLSGLQERLEDLGELTDYRVTERMPIEERSRSIARNISQLQRHITYMEKRGELKLELRRAAVTAEIDEQARMIEDMQGELRRQMEIKKRQPIEQSINRLRIDVERLRRTAPLRDELRKLDFKAFMSGILDRMAALQRQQQRWMEQEMQVGVWVELAEDRNVATVFHVHGGILSLEGGHLGSERYAVAGGAMMDSKDGFGLELSGARGLADSGDDPDRVGLLAALAFNFRHRRSLGSVRILRPFSGLRVGYANISDMTGLYAGVVGGLELYGNTSVSIDLTVSAIGIMNLKESRPGGQALLRVGFGF